MSGDPASERSESEYRIVGTVTIEPKEDSVFKQDEKERDMDLEVIGGGLLSIAVVILGSAFLFNAIKSPASQQQFFGIPLSAILGIIFLYIGIGGAVALLDRLY